MQSQNTKHPGQLQVWGFPSRTGTKRRENLPKKSMFSTLQLTYFFCYSKMTVIGNWLINSYWPQMTLAPDSLLALFFFFFFFFFKKPGTKKTQGCFPLKKESHSSVLFQLETAYSEHYLKPSNTWSSNI